MNLRHARRWVSNRPEPARALPKFWNRARKFAWISGVLGLALILSDGNGMWDDTPFQSPVSLVFAGIGLALALSLELARWNMAGTRIHWSRNAAESNAPAKLARWAPWLLWGIVLVGAGALVSGVVEGAIGFDQLVRAI